MRSICFDCSNFASSPFPHRSTVSNAATPPSNSSKRIIPILCCLTIRCRAWTEWKRSVKFVIRKVAARFPSSCSRRATKRRFERMRPDSTSRHFSPSHLVPATWFGAHVNCWMERKRLGLPGRLQRSADSLCLHSCLRLCADKLRKLCR